MGMIDFPKMFHTKERYSFHVGKGNRKEINYQKGNLMGNFTEKAKGNIFITIRFTIRFPSPKRKWETI